MTLLYIFVNKSKIIKNMAKDLFSIRLREARLMMGLSMDKLVERAGGVITKQSISRYEKGIMHPKRDAMIALTRALCISEAYFKGTNLKIDMPMLRTTSNGMLSDEELQALEAQLSFWTEQYLDKEQKADITSCFVNPIKGMAISTMEDAIKAADILREKWHCGDGPIASIVRLLERKGIKIMSGNLPDNVLGLSTWANKKYPLIVLDFQQTKTSVECLRFTACHELAHLLLTFPEESEFGLEKRCNMFASYFLFPKETFISEMGGTWRESLTLEEMIDLKELYGVSIAAQVHEAWDLKMITREHYDWWYDERINKNRKEIAWGEYKFPETVGREKRIESRINNIKH